MAVIILRRIFQYVIAIQGVLFLLMIHAESFFFEVYKSSCEPLYCEVIYVVFISDPSPLCPPHYDPRCPFVVEQADGPYVVTLILSHNTTSPNSTSPLLGVNQEIVYQALVIDGELDGYPNSGVQMNSPPAMATLLALALGVMKVTRWMQ